MTLATSKIFLRRVLFLIILQPVIAYAQSESDNTSPDSELLNFESWSVQCVRQQASEQRACFMYQPIFLKDGQRLLLFRVQKNVPMSDGASAADIAVITVPLGVHLPSGIALQIDDNNPISFAYERCDQGGCFSGAVLEDDLLSALKSGTACKLSFNDLSGQTITATLSLKGFTKAYNSM